MFTSNGGAFDIQFVDADNGWAVGGFGAILRTRDGGRTWTAQESGVAAGLGAVRFRSASEGYAFGADRLLLRTADGGSTWEALVGPQPAHQEGSFVGSAFLDLFGPAGIDMGASFQPVISFQQSADTPFSRMATGAKQRVRTDPARTEPPTRQAPDYVARGSLPVLEGVAVPRRAEVGTWWCSTT